METLTLYLDKYGMVEVREIDSNGKPEQKFFHKLTELEKYKPPEDRNVYFGLYLRGYNKNNYSFRGDSSNCLFTYALCLDYDFPDLEFIKRAIKNSGLPQPSIIVFSGRGYHCYWVLTEKVNDASDLVEAMARAVARRQGAVRGEFWYVEGSEQFVKMDEGTIEDTLRHLRPLGFQERAGELLGSQYREEFIQDVKKDSSWRVSPC